MDEAVIAGPKTRVALAGAGYVALRHLKALADLPFIEIAGICDMDRAKAEDLAAQFGIPNVARSLADILSMAKGIDVVHILTPPASHCELTLAALDAGCHVFVEKPMAETTVECDRMMARAKERGRVISVNHSARFEPPVLRALELMQSGLLGDVISVQHFRGSDYPPYAGGEPTAVHGQGSYPFRDLGVHALYLMEAFAGPVQSMEAHYGSSGKDPMLTFDEWRIHAAFERATGYALLSWNMLPVDNSLWIHTTRGTLHVDCFLQSCEFHKTWPGPKQLHAVINGMSHAMRRLIHIPAYLLRVLTGRAKPSPGIYNSVQAFHRALREGKPVPVPPEEGRRVVAMVAEHSIPADTDKERLEAKRRATRLRPAKILVTGANGFLGSALLRRLREAGENPRVFLRKPASAGDAAYGLDAIYGSLGEPDAVDRAVEGVDAVFHVGAAMKGWPQDFQAGTIWGTRNVIDACMKHKVKRLVYVSSLGIMDHAGHVEGVAVNEESPLEPHPEKRGLYSQTKLQAEELVKDAIREQGLPAVIVRPGQIFGPGAEQIPPNGVLKIAGKWLVSGMGRRNLPLVYVEDVVDGLIAALTHPEAAGQVVHLIDPTPLTQNQYLKACRPALGRTSVWRVPEFILMTAGIGFEILEKLLRRSLPLNRYRIRSLRPLSPIDISKARTLIGWTPRIGAIRGLQDTFAHYRKK